jgi:hypothetical protein
MVNINVRHINLFIILLNFIFISSAFFTAIDYFFPSFSPFFSPIK